MTEMQQQQAGMIRSKGEEKIIKEYVALEMNDQESQ